MLRRRWDLLDPSASSRRRLLRWLATLESLCHQRLAEHLQRQGEPRTELVELICGQLAEDDRYLVDLLENHSLPPEAAAFAVECFRDDLHWLSTQVAVLDGSGGVDFHGRVLLEEEAIEREIDAWSDAAAPESPDDAGPRARQDSAGVMPEDLRRSARQLRSIALARQIEALLAQEKPQDWQGWYRAWQGASRLAMRLGPESGAVEAPEEETDRAAGGLTDEKRRAVHEHRVGAARRWRQCLAELSPHQRRDALGHVADELVDVAGESLTFLEDISLPDAVRSLEILCEDVGTCLEAVEEHRGRKLRPTRRTLGRWRSTLAGELQERRLVWRMERLFGRRAVAALERFILLLLIIFVVMLTVEGPLLRWEGKPPHSTDSLVEAVFAWTDLVICLVFLGEFTLKMALAQRRWLYVWRNWITGLLPAIPVGFIAYSVHQIALAEEAELFVLLRALRYLRLPRMARWLRIARPALRAARLVGFTLRASDRLVRQLAPLINRNLTVFERTAVRLEEPAYRTALSALRERFNYRAPELIDSLPQRARRDLTRGRVADLTDMLSAPQAAAVAPAAVVETSATREIPLERVIDRLLSATPASISDQIGRAPAQSVARWCRALDVFAVRRLPLVREMVAAGRLPSPYETTARVANRIGLSLRHLLDRVYWVADLHGTVTAPQLVDSLGDWMVKGTSRPARRFLMIGIAFLAVSYLAGLLPFVPLKQLTAKLDQLIAAPLVILGTLCLLPLLLGLWFRQIAGEATDFYGRVAEAQFLAATKKLKRRLAKRHHAILHSRVIAPELTVAAESGVQSRESRTESGDSGLSTLESARSVVELLWEDYLDGAPFHHSDTKTTTQLLGNLVLVSLRETRLGHRRRHWKRLRRLDLANSRATLRGPYLWFHFISRSIAQQTAKLVVDYNAHALPLSRGATADRRQIDRYVRWLAGRLEKPVDQLQLPPQFRRRINAPSTAANEPAGNEKNKEDRSGRMFQGNDFTAIHFLSADAQLEADVRRRYGEAVAGLVRRDRRDNIRRVFRTYPFHHWPREHRTFNLLSLYQQHLAGGRILLLPVKMLWWTVLAAAHALRLLWTFVRDVLYPTVGDLTAVEEPDPYEVAVRKIHRMRKPVFLECLRMRAQFDPEYLGILLPGTSAGLHTTGTSPIEEDLALIGVEPGVVREFRGLAAQRRRQVLEFRRWSARFHLAKKPAPSLRAMAVAYTIDYRDVRSTLEAAQLLRRTFDEAIAPASQSPPAVEHRGCFALALWRRWRYAKRLERLFSRPGFEHYGQQQPDVCGRVLWARGGPLLRALKVLTDTDAADPLQDAREVLSAVADDPDTWSRQLVVLRAVQTLSVLDLWTYCDLVAELGEYEAYTPEEMDVDVPDHV